MSNAREGVRPLYTGALTFAPDEKFQGVHSKINVDDVVHIDADHSDGVIRVLHDKTSTTDVFRASDKETGSVTMRIDNFGVYHGNLAGNVMANTILFGGTNLETYLANDNLDDIQQRQVLQTSIDALELVVEPATHEDPDPGTNSLVRRNAVLGTSIANLNVLSRETAYAPTESWPPSGLTFDHATTLGHIDLLANARLLFQPYDAQGNPLSDRIFSFGRAWPAEGQQPMRRRTGCLW